MKRLHVMLAAVLASSLWATLPVAAGAPALQKRSFTVVAVVDSGINPYHVDFRRPELTAHPSTYIEGFPSEVKALELSLDAGSYPAAVARDAAKWKSVGNGDLFWIPGTNIIGAMTLSDDSVLDEVGHGTPVASLVSGAVHGPPSDDIVIVAVEGFTQGVEWAAQQPWIDVITNSWGAFSHNPRAVVEPSRKAVANGKVVCFASGNFAVPLWMSGSQGPSWHVNVGAASATTRGEHAYTGYPNDVLGPSQVPAATADSIDGEAPFAGTSAATPNVCGEIAMVVAEVRSALGDRSEGSTRGLARGPRGSGPYLKDGCLDRAEVEEAIQATARPAEPSPPDPEDTYAIPASPAAPFIRGGYGIVDEDSAKDALDVLFGRKEKPARDLEDSWIDATDQMRDAIYGETPPPKGC